MKILPDVSQQPRFILGIVVVILSAGLLALLILKPMPIAGPLALALGVWFGMMKDAVIGLLTEAKPDGKA